MPKQEIIIRPEVQLTCRHCINWNRYKLYNGENQNWGVCSVKDVPNYMREMYIDNGCNFHSNLHSNLINKKITKCCNNKQLSIFDK